VRVRLKVLKISAVAQVLRSGPALDSRLFVDARAFVNLGGSGMSLSLMVNGIAYTADVEPETPLLWVLRDSLKLTGTKFGCGIAQCGACTVLIDGQATRSCSVPASAVTGKAVTTIEGLSAEGTHPVQLAWIELDVPQCGYCQSGQIMAAVALLKDKPKPTDEEINREMTNICRCGTYPRIRAAIHRAAELQA
jgi:isoquinoline 1-oxidoreductase alpha subunit